jgi:hypothetical protein
MRAALRQPPSAVSWACGWPTIRSFFAADVVFVATPPAALGYAGIILSAMVPGAGGYDLKRDDGTSAAEQLARLVPTGRVVTGFASISSPLIRDPASGEKPTVFTCADDEAARSTVIALAPLSPFGTIVEPDACARQTVKPLPGYRQLPKFPSPATHCPATSPAGKWLFLCKTDYSVRFGRYLAFTV